MALAVIPNVSQQLTFQSKGAFSIGLNFCRVYANTFYVFLELGQRRKSKIKELPKKHASLHIINLLITFDSVRIFVNVSS